MTPSQITNLRGLRERATQDEWQVQDGCSWRRIGTAFHDGNVLAPTTHPNDGWPDLIARDGKRDHNLALIVAAVNALPSLLDTAERVERLEAALRAFVSEEVVYLTGAEPDDEEQAVWVPASDIRAARALLAETADGDGK